jgi:hypothetical protein
MRNIKHVGKVLNTGRRCIVVFREIPGEEDHCLVVDTDSLPDRYHDNIMEAVESITAQEANNFYEYAQRQMFSDGTNMLTTLHTHGWLKKHPDWNIAMTPNANMEIKLTDLNRMIREQQGEKPIVKEEIKKEQVKPDPNFDENKFKAKDLLAQAQLLSQDVERLTKEAYTLDPSLKPKVSKSTSRTTKKTANQKKTEPVTTSK